MKMVKFDEDGVMRCHKCDGINFKMKRTVRAKIIGWVTIGIGALATKKKAKCLQCGKYNDTK